MITERRSLKIKLLKPHFLTILSTFLQKNCIFRLKKAINLNRTAKDYLRTLALNVISNQTATMQKLELASKRLVVLKLNLTRNSVCLSLQLNHNAFAEKKSQSLKLISEAINNIRFYLHKNTNLFQYTVPRLVQFDI